MRDRAQRTLVVGQAGFVGVNVDGLHHPDEENQHNAEDCQASGEAFAAIGLVFRQCRVQMQFSLLRTDAASNAAVATSY
jgi:hypothetical protein